jgi:hypothetical protein
VPLLATTIGPNILGSCAGLLVASPLILLTAAIRTRIVPGIGTIVLFERLVT